MFKRLRERLNYWAEVLDMDDPPGEYVLQLEQRVTQLERDIEDLHIQSRATPVGPDERALQWQGDLQR
jgi:hypothetical protein